MKNKAFKNKSSFRRISVRDIMLFLYRPIPRINGGPQGRGDEAGVKAFTLIELLVVVLIIGILAAVALPGYQKAVEKSKMTQALVIADSLKKSLDMEILANGLPPNAMPLIGMDIETSLPTDHASTVSMCINKVPWCYTMGDFMYGGACMSTGCWFAVIKFHKDSTEYIEEYYLRYEYQPSIGWTKSYTQSSNAKANLKPEFQSLGFTTN